MTFISPLLLWSFLALIPLVAVYLLKVRPRPKTTNAYFLWQQIFSEKRPNRLLNRLRDFWSLLLIALAFAAVCLAVANPQLTGDRREDVLIVIDNSASMSAKDGVKTRLQRAQGVARGIVRAFNGAQRAAVATLSQELQFRSHFTDNPRELLDAINAIGPSDHSLHRASLDSMVPEDAGAEGQWSNRYRIMLVTDGCFDVQDLPARIELLKVGEPGQNVGIVKADVKYLPGGENQLGLYFQVGSSFESAQQIDLLVTRQDDPDRESLRKLIPLDVQPGLNRSEVFTIENAEPGRWLVRLDIQDALDRDNAAYLSVSQPPPVRVSVQTDDRFFFENSVEAFSHGAGLLTLVDDDPQVVVSKSVTPEAERSLIFFPQGDSVWWSDLDGELETVAPRLLVADHPALRHLESLSIPFIGVRRLQPPAGAQVLVAGDEGTPLIYQSSHQGRTAIVVNMDPLAAEFYFSAWFPVLVHSTVTYLAGREDSLMATYPPNSRVPIPGAQGTEATRIVFPEGYRDQVSGQTMPPLDYLGFYQLENANGNWTVACSLLSEQETQLDNSQVEDTSRPISRGWPIAHLLTVMALVVVTTESLLYYRRKVG